MSRLDHFCMERRFCTAAGKPADSVVHVSPPGLLTVESFLFHHHFLTAFNVLCIIIEDFVDLLRFESDLRNTQKENGCFKQQLQQYIELY